MAVRISDVNYGGHLGNDAVLSLAHEARIRYLGTLGYTELDIEGLGIIMTDAVIVYRAESFHGDRLRIEVAVDSFHSHGCDFVYRISRADDSREIARLKTGIAFFDYAKRKIAQLPVGFREKTLKKVL
ncbi:MAG: thioesterase family protein [Bacteroidota bacterium]